MYSMHIPWYANGFRGDKLEAALAEIAAVSLRYGALHYSVYRAHDDRNKFLQIADFQNKAQWVDYWNGPEMVRFRTIASGWFQVPPLYYPQDIAAEGSMPALVPEGERDPAA